MQPWRGAITLMSCHIFGILTYRFNFCVDEEVVINGIGNSIRDIVNRSFVVYILIMDLYFSDRNNIFAVHMKNVLTYCKKRFVLYPLREIANFNTEKDECSQRTLMLVVYPLPDKGTSIFDKAWEWTVYFSVRRLAMPP